MTRFTALLLWMGCARPEVSPPQLGSPSCCPVPPDDTSVVSQPPQSVLVTVFLDDVPQPGVEVFQGGVVAPSVTDASGQVEVEIDLEIPGILTLIANHPDARQRAAEVTGPTAEIRLSRFDRTDNLDYLFQHPGTPDDRGDTSRCGHCHVTLDDDWYASPHRTSASNPVVQDVYAGAATAFATESDCVAAGGAWWEGLAPGTGTAAYRCYVGAGALPDLNEDCGDLGACDGVADQTGACADCHAPGIDGVLGGRDLLEATGIAYDFGVHCDVCHKVEHVDLTAPAGVAGRLGILRPIEPSESPALVLEPLSFGPWGDVASPRMGAVQRELFHDTTLCAGCHELAQEVLVPGAFADPVRWPAGVLPIHTTWSEWETGPMNPASPCQACHMPPDPDVGNAADLYNLFDGLIENIGTGWGRPPGTVRKHVWVGPRTPSSGMLELAASVDLSVQVEGDEVVVDATVKNVGPGHALPTGEPLRHLLLVVRADCPAPLDPIGGDALPDYAGARSVQDATGDWSVWPGAVAGDVIRVVSRPGGYHDYTGHGPFGDGTFDAVAKGLVVEEIAGERTILSVGPGDVVTLDAPLPVGDVAYLGASVDLPVDGDAALPIAGAPGFSFARVLAGADGQRMVPHHAAVDVVSDNRLLPQDMWTSTHRFEGTGCTTPTARAALVYRTYPLALATEKGWVLTERVMAEAVR